MSATLLDRAAVEQRVAMRRSAIYARIAAGTFPKPVPIGGPAGKPTAVRWLESDVTLWIEARIAERDAAA
jgi:prophage regulatory protein